MSKGNFFNYLTHSDEDRKWQIVCNDAGYTVINPGSAYPPDKEKHPDKFKSVTTGRILNEYQLIYITQGQGVFYCGHKKHIIRPGTVMLIFPGVSHHYMPDKSTGWIEYWIGFSGDYPDRLRQEGVLSPSKSVYSIGYHDTLLYFFDKLFDQVREQKPGYQIRSSSDTISLLAEVICLEKNRNIKSGDEELVERVKFLLEENLYENIDLDFVSGEIGLSKVRIQNIFREYTGMTPYQFYLNLKINKAKEWLDYGTYSVKEISYRLSFKDPCYFSRLFTKKTGISPSRWNIQVEKKG